MEKFFFLKKFYKKITINFVIFTLFFLEVHLAILHVHLEMHNKQQVTSHSYTYLGVIMTFLANLSFTLF